MVFHVVWLLMVVLATGGRSVSSLGTPKRCCGELAALFRFVIVMMYVLLLNSFTTVYVILVLIFAIMILQNRFTSVYLILIRASQAPRCQM